MVESDIPAPEVSGNTVSIEAFVYVIAAAADAVKVGVARDTWNRLRALQTGHYQKLSIAHQIGFSEEDEAYAIERRAHKLLSPKRAEGEWFKVSPEEAKAAVEQAIKDRQEDQRREREELARIAATEEEALRAQHVYLGPEITPAKPWMRTPMDVIRFVLAQKEPEKEHLISFGDCILFVACRTDEQTGEYFFFMNDVSRWHMREEDGSPYNCDKPSSSPLGNPPCALFATVYEPSMAAA
jgi:hypothetical protein